MTLATLYDAPSVEKGLADLQSPLRLADSVLLTAAAAGDYAAGDAISQSATDTAGTPLRVNNMARVAGGTAVLQGVRAICVATNGAVLAPIRLYWFMRQPTPAEVEMDDNVAFVINNQAGANKLVGSTLLSAFVDRGVISVSDTTGMQEALRTDPNEGGGLWCLPTFEAAEANESANMTFRFDFYCY